MVGVPLKLGYLCACVYARARECVYVFSFTSFIRQLFTESCLCVRFLSGTEDRVRGKEKPLCGPSIMPGKSGTMP